MVHPLSRAETLEVFDQLRGVGMLPDDMYSEARDCIMLADESASQSIGGTGAMFKSVVLPQRMDIALPLPARRAPTVNPTGDGGGGAAGGAVIRQPQSSSRKLLECAQSGVKASTSMLAGWRSLKLRLCQ
jgi:hypothetical protein